MLTTLMSLAAGAVPLAMAPPSGDGAGPGNVYMQFLPLVMVVGIFYLLVFRPQQEKAKQHQAMLDGLKKGDEVLTAGGIYGKVQALSDQVVTLEIAPNVRIRVARARIESNEPAKETKGESKSSE